MKMNKKAQKELLWLIYILLVSIIILTLMYSIKKIQQGNYYQEKLISKDIAMFYDAVMASPYKTEAAYKIYEGNNLLIEMLENCFVKVSSTQGTSTISYCALNTYLDVNCKSQKNCFVKNKFITFQNG